MTYETVLYEKRADGIALLTLNRPTAGNSINAVMDREMGEIWENVKADDGVKVVVLSAAGDRFFCSGADMKEWAATRVLAMARMPKGRGFRLLARDHHVFKPIVCAVNGICGGGGLHFVNDSDIVICADTATFMDPHVSVGQVSSEEPIALSRRVPFEFVMRLTLMGVHERVSAQRAFQVGRPFRRTRPTRRPAREWRLSSSGARRSSRARRTSSSSWVRRRSARRHS